MKEFTDTFDKLYNNFLLRDIAFIVSGSFILIVLLLPFYSLLGFDYLTKISIVAVAFSYYIGMIIHELWIYMGIIRIYPPENKVLKTIARYICGKNIIEETKNPSFVEQEVEYLLNIIEINNSEKFKPGSLKSLERIIAIKTATGAFASASITSLIFILIFYFMHQLPSIIEKNIGYIIFILLIFIIAGLIGNWKKACVQSLFLKNMVKKI